MILKIGKRILIVAVVLSSFIAVSYARMNDCSDLQSVRSDSVWNNVSILKELEKEDSLTGARVIVVNNTNVLFFKKENEVIKGYRVRLFFDNSQTARTQAEELKALFENKYPEQMAYLHYSTPYFNVTVGDFSTYQDALVFTRKILGDFPKAFIVPSDIPVLNLGTRVIVPPIDSTTVVEQDESLIDE